MLYESRGGTRKNDVLERYKIAWTKLHNSPPPLANGSPVNFLPNPAYTLSKHIPWFDQASFLPENEQQAGSSTVHQEQRADPQPSSSSVEGLSSPLGLPRSMHDVLVSSRTKITLEGSFPHIIGGLNDGHTEYLKKKNTEKLGIGAVFILDPKFKVDTMEPNAYFAPVVTHPKDAEAVAREMGGCIPLSKDQKGCQYPQNRYLCMSWVRISTDSFIFYFIKLIITIAAPPCIRIDRDV